MNPRFLFVYDTEFHLLETGLQNVTRFDTCPSDEFSTDRLNSATHALLATKDTELAKAVLSTKIPTYFLERVPGTLFDYLPLGMLINQSDYAAPTLREHFEAILNAFPEIESIEFTPALEGAVNWCKAGKSDETLINFFKYTDTQTHEIPEETINKIGNSLAEWHINSRYRNDPQAVGLGLEAAETYFKDHELDLFDSARRTQSQPLAKRFLELLSIDDAAQRTLKNHYKQFALGSLFWAYNPETFGSLAQKMARFHINFHGFPAYAGFLLWARGYTADAKEWFEQENFGYLSNPSDLHRCLATACALGLTEIANKLISKIKPGYLCDPIDNLEKYTLQALIAQTLGLDDSARFNLEQAQAYDVDFERRRVLLEIEHARIDSAELSAWVEEQSGTLVGA